MELEKFDLTLEEKEQLRNCLSCMVQRLNVEIAEESIPFVIEKIISENIVIMRDANKLVPFCNKTDSVTYTNDSMTEELTKESENNEYIQNGKFRASIIEDGLRNNEEENKDMNETMIENVGLTEIKELLEEILKIIRPKISENDISNDGNHSINDEGNNTKNIKETIEEFPGEMEKKLENNRKTEVKLNEEAFCGPFDSITNLKLLMKGVETFTKAFYPLITDCKDEEQNKVSEAENKHSENNKNDVANLVYEQVNTDGVTKVESEETTKNADVATIKEFEYRADNEVEDCGNSPIKTQEATNIVTGETGNDIAAVQIPEAIDQTEVVAKEADNVSTFKIEETTATNVLASGVIEIEEDAAKNVAEDFVNESEVFISADATDNEAHVEINDTNEKIEDEDTVVENLSALEELTVVEMPITDDIKQKEIDVTENKIICVPATDEEFKKRIEKNGEHVAKRPPIACLKFVIKNYFPEYLNCFENATLIDEEKYEEVDDAVTPLNEKVNKPPIQCLQFMIKNHFPEYMTYFEKVMPFAKEKNNEVDDSLTLEKAIEEMAEKVANDEEVDNVLQVKGTPVKDKIEETQVPGISTSEVAEIAVLPTEEVNEEIADETIPGEPEAVNAKNEQVAEKPEIVGEPEVANLANIVNNEALVKIDSIAQADKVHPVASEEIDIVEIPPDKNFRQAEVDATRGDVAFVPTAEGEIKMKKTSNTENFVKRPPIECLQSMIKNHFPEYMTYFEMVMPFVEEKVKKSNDAVMALDELVEEAAGEVPQAEEAVVEDIRVMEEIEEIQTTCISTFEIGEIAVISTGKVNEEISVVIQAEIVEESTAIDEIISGKPEVANTENEDVAEVSDVVDEPEAVNSENIADNEAPITIDSTAKADDVHSVTHRETGITEMPNEERVVEVDATKGITPTAERETEMDNYINSENVVEKPPIECLQFMIKNHFPEYMTYFEMVMPFDEENDQEADVAMTTVGKKAKRPPIQCLQYMIKNHFPECLTCLEKVMPFVEEKDKEADVANAAVNVVAEQTAREVPEKEEAVVEDDPPVKDTPFIKVFKETPTTATITSEVTEVDVMSTEKVIEEIRATDEVLSRKSEIENTENEKTTEEPKIFEEAEVAVDEDVNITNIDFIGAPSADVVKPRIIVSGVTAKKDVAAADVETEVVENFSDKIASEEIELVETAYDEVAKQPEAIYKPETADATDIVDNEGLVKVGVAAKDDDETGEIRDETSIEEYTKQTKIGAAVISTPKAKEEIKTKDYINDENVIRRPPIECLQFMIKTYFPEYMISAEKGFHIPEEDKAVDIETKKMEELVKKHDVEIPMEGEVIVKEKTVQIGDTPTNYEIEKATDVVTSELAKVEVTVTEEVAEKLEIAKEAEVVAEEDDNTPKIKMEEVTDADVVASGVTEVKETSIKEGAEGSVIIDELRSLEIAEIDAENEITGAEVKVNTIGEAPDELVCEEAKPDYDIIENSDFQALIFGSTFDACFEPSDECLGLFIRNFYPKYADCFKKFILRKDE